MKSVQLRAAQVAVEVLDRMSGQRRHYAQDHALIETLVAAAIQGALEDERDRLLALAVRIENAKASSDEAQP